MMLRTRFFSFLPVAFTACRTSTLFTCLTTALLVCSTAFAATNNWQAVSGNWSTGSYWSLGREPTSSDNVYINVTNASVNITNTGEAAGLVYLGASSGTSSVTLTSGSLSARTEFIGYAGTGAFVQNGGSNTMTNVLQIGDDTGDSGYYTLNAGTLSASTQYVGFHGAGSFTQNGGSNSATTLYAGGWPNGYGAYVMKGGTLNVSSTLNVGAYCLGVFTQTGGNVTAASLGLGSGDSRGNGTYNLYGGTLTVGSVYKGSGSGQLNLGGGLIQATRTAYWSAPITVNGHSGDSTIDTNGNDVTLSGALSGNGGLIKDGQGMLTIRNSANTYSGNLAVNAGTLLVTGTLGADSLVTVNSGAVLGGTGTVGSVVVNDGGTLSPGASIGTLTLTGDLTLADDALLAYELAAPGGSDLISMTNGLLTIDGLDLLNFTFEFDTLVAGVYTLIDAASISGSLGSLLTTTLYGLTARLSLSDGGDDVILTLNAPPQNVPEPGSLLIWGAGLAGLALLRRRNGRRQ